MFEKVHRFWWLLGLFCIVFFPIILCCGYMGLDCDALGMIYDISRHPFSLDIFSQSVQQKYMALNEAVPQVQIHALYRPLQHAMFYLIFYFFGTSGYAYFVISIFLHTSVTCLLFLVLTRFFSFRKAFIVALVFAYHPAHTPSFLGLTWAVNPTYVLFFCSLLFFIVFFESQFWLCYPLSIVFYCTSLLSYELPFIFPVVLLLGLVLFKRNWIVYSLPFFLVNIGYVLFRYLQLGGAKDSFDLVFFRRLIFAGIANVYQSFRPFWGFQYFSKNYAFSLVVMLFVLAVFTMALADLRLRRSIVFYFCSFCLLSWPVYLVNSSTRYFYLAVPFFCLMLYDSIHLCMSSLVGRKRGRQVSLLILALFVIFGVGHTLRALRDRSEYTYRRDCAFEQLAQKYRDDSVVFVLVGTPYVYNNQCFLMMCGMMQALRLFFNDPDLSVYHEVDAKIYVRGCSDHNVEVTPVEGGYRLTTSDSDSVFLMGSYGDTQMRQPSLCSMGKMFVHSFCDHWRASDVSFIFDPKFFQAS